MEKIESNKIKTRVSNLKRGEDGWLSSVIRKLPESGLSLTNEVVESYTEMLNKFLNDGIKISGNLTGWDSHFIENNTANNKSIVYYKNKNDYDIINKLKNIS